MAWFLVCLAGSWLVLSVPAAGRAEEAALESGAPAPPERVGAVDRPNDNGGAIVVSWIPSPDDFQPHGRVTGYTVLRSTRSIGRYQVVGRTPAGSTRLVDVAATKGVPFYYKVEAVAGELASASPPVGPVSSTHQWINWDRWNRLLLSLLLGGTILYFILAGQRGRRLRIRKLPGIQEIEKAIGHAAAAGRPVFFVPGSEDLNEIQTIAGLTVLEEVTKVAADREVNLRVPQFHSLVMAAADDTLRHAYGAVGRAGAYDPFDNFYVSDEQFGFVAGVNGLMCREKPAVCLYFGSFFAEGLALAEVGQDIGAVQIAGTAERAQIPFLLTACDHVLIGEELFAAAAYLSGDPRKLGCLRGQDFGKLMAAGAIIVGCLLATLVTLSGSSFLELLHDSLRSIFDTGARE